MKIHSAYRNDCPVSRFDAAAFAAPGVENAVFYAWVWNAPIDRQGICDRLDEMQRMGIRATYILPEPKTFRPASIPTMMEPDYLTPPYFELFAFAMEEAERRGIRTWLYDEGGWPSGSACGKVLLENPHLAKHALASREVSVPAGQHYVPAADALAAFDKDGCLVYCADDDTVPAAFEEETSLKEYYARRCFFEAPGVPDYPDLMLRESCDAFLASTHEKYAPYLAGQLGKNMTAVFTDEAKAPGLVPFAKGIRERFESEYGYSVLPYLPALEKWLHTDAPALDAPAARAAVDFYDLASRMLCENWLMPQKEWCNSYGMCFTGHMDRDDEPCAGMIGFCWHLLRALRCLDIPGVDVIWRQLWPGKPVPARIVGTLSNGFFPRYAASAAAQNGSPYALTETAAIYGNGLTPEKLRWLLGYQAVRGINRFNLNSFTHSTDGWMMGGALPSFREHNACYADLAPFNAWAQRLAWAASQGRRAAEIALYQPVRDIWAGDTGIVQRFDALGRALDACGAEFDIFDDDVLENADPAALDGGELRLNLALYRTLVLPAGASLPPESETVLRRFMAGGGRVCCVGGECALPGVEIIADVQSAFGHALPLSGDTEGIRISRRELEDGTLYIVFNEKDAPARFGVAFDGRSVRRLWLQDGRVSTAADGELTLESGEVAVFLCGNCAAALPAAEEPVFAHVMPLGGPWSIRPVKRLHLGEMKVETQYPDVPAQPTIPGDWRAQVGEDFSGSCLYETAFALEEIPVIAALDLGDVKYTCTVTLNGVQLGTQVMPPYRYALPAGVLQQQNSLQITVTNTAANEYGCTDTFDKWQPWQLAKESYFARELEQDKDAYPSGLYGPVVLRF